MKKAWVLTGDGINCEVETAEACRRVGFETSIFHLSELVAKPLPLSSCSLLVIPGGFSFGDELGSGRVLALKLKYQLGWDLPEFARQGGLVLGICNGFQALVALGVFGKGVALAPNETGRFINEWATLTVDPAAGAGPFLQGMTNLELPIRHGEGRLLFHMENRHPAHAAIRYQTNPNGSTDHLAALIDSTGRILGMMPHPEGFQRASQHPRYFRERAGAFAAGSGLQIFQNAFKNALTNTP